MEELLELMRVQRHNFANHLQVISGLLQLKKYDRAFEYIKGVGEELNRAGAVARLEIPQLVREILVAELAAETKGIHLEYQIHNNMGGYKGSADKLVLIVQEMLYTAIQFLEDNIDAESVIKFEIHEKDGTYLIKLRHPVGDLKGYNDILSAYHGIKEKIEAQGWLLSIEENNQYLITLTI